VHRGRRWTFPWVVLGILAVVLGLAAASALRVPARGQGEAGRPRAETERIAQQAQARLEAGDVAGAESLWRRAAEVDPHCAKPWVQIGRLALQRREFREAVDHFGQALALSPDQYEALDGLAVAHRMLGHEAQARDLQGHAERARRALPPNPGGMGSDALPASPGERH
jgi:Tfp pilus assembly protein PilF